MVYNRKRDPTPAQDRGKIDKASMGDSTRGFNPAAAPTETDPEAGDAGHMAKDREAPKPSRNINETSDGTAMRPMEAHRGGNPANIGYALIGIVIALAVGLGIGLIFAS